MVKFALYLKCQSVRTLYNLGIRLYWSAICIASRFNSKAKLFKEGRRGLIGRIAGEVAGAEHIIWFHSASVGEFEQARPLIEWIKEHKPQYRILLTFFSPSGYELRKNYNKADWVFYLPIDTPHNAKAFLEAVKPERAIFVKYEFWHNYLHQLKKRGIPTYIICAIFRPGQNFFKWYGGFFRNMLRCFTELFVQDNDSAALLAGIGIRENVTICGDTRFDRVSQIASASSPIPAVESFTKNSFPIIAGSTWPPDEELFRAQLGRLQGERIKLVLVPHEIGKTHIEQILKTFEGYKTALYTSLERDVESSRLEDTDVLIIDTIGMLSSIYRYGKCAYIGGGFGVGIHNTLEPAVYGIPVLFGPKYGKFKEARDLIASGGALSVKEGEELRQKLQTLISNPDELKTRGDACIKYVASNIGSTKAIVEALQL